MGGIQTYPHVTPRCVLYNTLIPLITMPTAPSTKMALWTLFMFTYRRACESLPEVPA
jgi:hypothetical protein